MNEAVTLPKKKTNRTTVVTSVSLPPKMKAAASKKAFGQKWGLSTYIQSLIEQDLAGK